MIKQNHVNGYLTMFVNINGNLTNQFNYLFRIYFSSGKLTMVSNNECHIIVKINVKFDDKNIMTSMQKECSQKFGNNRKCPYIRSKSINIVFF